MKSRGLRLPVLKVGNLLFVATAHAFFANMTWRVTTED